MRRTSFEPYNPGKKGLVLKVQRHSMYSSKYKKTHSKGRPSGPPREMCKNCNLTHRKNNCGAAGQKLYTCQGIGHYGRTPVCLGRRRSEDQNRRHSAPSRI